MNNEIVKLSNVQEVAWGWPPMRFVNLDLPFGPKGSHALSVGLHVVSRLAEEFPDRLQGNAKEGFPTVVAQPVKRIVASGERNSNFPRPQSSSIAEHSQ